MVKLFDEVKCLFNAEKDPQSISVVGLSSFRQLTHKMIERWASGITHPELYSVSHEFLDPDDVIPDLSEAPDLAVISIRQMQRQVWVVAEDSHSGIVGEAQETVFSSNRQLVGQEDELLYHKQNGVISSHAVRDIKELIDGDTYVFSCTAVRRSGCPR